MDFQIAITPDGKGVKGFGSVLELPTKPRGRRGRRGFLPALDTRPPSRLFNRFGWKARSRQVNAVEIDGHTVAFAPPEYVMIRKMEFFREGGSSKEPWICKRRVER